MSGSPRLRLGLIALAVMIVSVAVLSVAARSLILAGFSAIEHDDAVANVERAGAELTSRVDELRRLARDWAGWDDTYGFVAGEFDGFPAMHLTPDALTNLGVSHMLFFDAERRLVHGAGVSADGSRTEPPADELVSAIATTDELFELPKPTSTAGVIVYSTDGLTLAGAAPITDSSLTKPIRGTLVMLAPLDEAAVESIAEQTKLSVAVVNGSRSMTSLTSTAQRLGGSDALGASPVFAQDDSRMVGMWPIRVAGGKEPLALAVRLERPVWRQGLKVSHWLSVGIAVIGVALVIAFMTFVDRRIITESRELLEQAVAERTREVATSEARFRDLVDHMAQGLLALDEGGRITFANRAAERLFGRSRTELLGLRAGDLFIEEDVERHLVGDEARTASVSVSIQRYGTPVPVEIVATGTGEGASGQWLVRDVTMQRRYEQQLVHLASHDHLTGLANRRRFEEELTRDVALAERTGRGGGILWLDLDDFKEINDTLGHRSGDELLVGIANFLLSSTRAASLVARIGGDEFAILVPEATLAEIESTAGRLQAEMAKQRFEISGHRLALTVSIGVASYPDHGTSVEELLSRADIAMYHAKESGHGGYRVWAPESGDDSNRTRLEWSERIRRAVENDEVVVHAQPIADAVTGEIRSYELLMRLQADEPGELIMPNDFLPAAERLGLIRELDRWMTLNAIRLVARTPAFGVVHVNLSGRAFADPGLLGLIEREFQETGADPTGVGFEITETAAIADIAAAKELISGLRRLGCSLSLDDFGSGFSSFYYLRNLPIDRLKIDGAFITQLTSSEEDRHLVRAIVELARALGLSTVAEYVEDDETLEMIRDMGVTYAQGYHVGRPVPVDEVVERYLASQ